MCGVCKALLSLAVVGLAAGCGGEIGSPSSPPAPQADDAAGQPPLQFAEDLDETDQTSDGSTASDPDPVEQPPMENGVELEILNFAGVAEVRVLLTEGLDCTAFDPARLPAPTAQCATAEETLGLSGYRTTVSFEACSRAVRFTAVAVARVDGVLAAAGCRADLNPFHDRPARGEVKLASLLTPPRPSADLVVETRFNQSVEDALTALALRLTRLKYGPLSSYLEGQGSPAVRGFMAAHEGSLRPLAAADSELQQGYVAADGFWELAHQLTNPRMITAMKVGPSSQVTTVELAHAFDHFRFDLRDGLGQRWFGTPGAAVSTELRVSVPGRATIDAHVLSVPLGEAVIGRLLREALGKSDLRAALDAVAGCSRLATLASTLEDGIDAPLLEDCNALVKQQAELAQTEMTQHGFGGAISFGGSGSLFMAADGQTIAAIRNGTWQSLGTFKAHRP